MPQALAENAPSMSVRGTDPSASGFLPLLREMWTVITFRDSRVPHLRGLCRTQDVDQSFFRCLIVPGSMWSRRPYHPIHESHLAFLIELHLSPSALHVAEYLLADLRIRFFSPA